MELITWPIGVTFCASFVFGSLIDVLMVWSFWQILERKSECAEGEALHIWAQELLQGIGRIWDWFLATKGPPRLDDVYFLVVLGD